MILVIGDRNGLREHWGAKDKKEKQRAPALFFTFHDPHPWNRERQQSVPLGPLKDDDLCPCIGTDIHSGCLGFVSLPACPLFPWVTAFRHDGNESTKLLPAVTIRLRGLSETG
jgi:hypothetical protein